MPNQKVRFDTQQVEFIHIDVEGDGKQIVSRIATDQDKVNYGSEYAAAGLGGPGGTARSDTTRPTQNPSAAQASSQTQPGVQGTAAQSQPGANQTTDQASQQTQDARNANVTGAPQGGIGQAPQNTNPNQPR